MSIFIHPRLNDYLVFVDEVLLHEKDVPVEKRLITRDKMGNFRVNKSYSSTLLKLFVVHYWDMYKEGGVSEEELWGAFNAIANDQGNLMFDANGRQLNYIKHLDYLNSIVIGNMTLNLTIKNYKFYYLISIVYFIVTLVLVSLLAFTKDSGDVAATTVNFNTTM